MITDSDVQLIPSVISPPQCVQMAMILLRRTVVADFPSPM
jgi:hypothetical protein